MIHIELDTDKETEKAVANAIQSLLECMTFQSAVSLVP